jgi:peptidoglycan hydrolase CwlO-like protein
MKTKLKMSLLTAGSALIILSGCVSSKKYHASQADVAKLKGDSAQLQQQVTTLNGNVQDLQNKNTALQGNLDKSNSSLADNQKNLDYYQNYFKQQQGMMSHDGRHQQRRCTADQQHGLCSPRRERTV